MIDRWLLVQLVALDRRFLPIIIDHVIRGSFILAIIYRVQKIDVLFVEESPSIVRHETSVIFSVSTLGCLWSFWLRASPSFVFFILIVNASPSCSDTIFVWILSSIVDEVLLKKRVLLKYLLVYSELLERQLRRVQSLAVTWLRFGHKLNLLHHCWSLLLITLRYSMLMMHKVMLTWYLLIKMMILLLIKDLCWMILRVDLRVVIRRIIFLIHRLISPWIILRHLRYWVLRILLLTHKIWWLRLTHIKLRSLAIIALTLRRTTFFYYWRYSTMMVISLNRLWKVLLLLILFRCEYSCRTTDFHAWAFLFIILRLYFYLKWLLLFIYLDFIQKVFMVRRCFIADHLWTAICAVHRWVIL